MKTLLMYPDREFDLQRALPWNEAALMQDLELGTLLSAMAANDDFLLEVARKALLSGMRNDVATVLYRQAILKDCLKNAEVIGELYAVALGAIEGTRRRGLGLLSRFPSSLLYSALDSLEVHIHSLKQLVNIAEQHAHRFQSEGFTAMFAMLRRELTDDYLARIRNHLAELKFRKGVLLTSELSESNESTNHVLRQSRDQGPNWLQRILGKGPPAYTFYIAPRDEAGGRIVSDMRQRGISRVAVALAQSAEHVLGFFSMLRAELAFYIGCLNLHAQLAGRNGPVCFPVPAPTHERRHAFTGLYDVSLALHMNRAVVGNRVDANGKNLVIITGANQGGKSTFLRSLGQAQLMMQCGMFVGAEMFQASVYPALYTHYKREEDATMRRGKLDEELARISEVVDHLVPNSMLLFNESFAATNEREGSEIAKQIVRALLEKRMKIFYVTHLYTFAHCFNERKQADVMFLRAERKSDGARTFRMIAGEPLETSYGEDVYREVFAAEKPERRQIV